MIPFSLPVRLHRAQQAVSYTLNTWAFIKNLCSNAHYQARETTMPVLEGNDNIYIGNLGAASESGPSGSVPLLGGLFLASLVLRRRWQAGDGGGRVRRS